MKRATLYLRRKTTSWACYCIVSQESELLVDAKGKVRARANAYLSGQLLIFGRLTLRKSGSRSRQGELILF